MANAKALRDRLQWSQSDLGAYLCCHQSTVDRLEDGRSVSGAITRLLERLHSLVVDGLALPGMSVADVVKLAIRCSDLERPSRTPHQSAETVG